VSERAGTGDWFTAARGCEQTGTAQCCGSNVSFVGVGDTLRYNILLPLFPPKAATRRHHFEAPSPKERSSEGNLLVHGFLRNRQRALPDTAPGQYAARFPV
jgi:hypothetical protein